MKRVTLCLVLAMVCTFTFSTQAQDLTQTINQELSQFVENNKLSGSDMDWVITNENVSRTSGVHHVYFLQRVNGLDVYGTESSVHILPNGTVLASNIRFVENSDNRVSGSASPGLSAVQAVNAAATQLNYTISEELTVLDVERGLSQKTLMSKGGISLSEIPAELMYQLDDNNKLVLTWNLSIEETSRLNWWSVRVDATTGAIVDKNNWMVTCTFEHDHSEDVDTDHNKYLVYIPNYEELIAQAEAGCNQCYEVFALPFESPYAGPRTTEINPADPTASPFGWHDTNGVSGPEFTVTEGNNVNAFEAGDNSGYQPDGGASLDFTGYPYDPTWTNANQYEDASITNLFYWNNIIHDVLYHYGFDEVGGNFQENNYGNGGAGSDSVNANDQISQFCNATFGTPPDGSNPTMNMFICNNRDGAYDNLVVVHEYGHGISNRLTGGPAAAGCLGNSEQMGEGWSDYYGVIMSIEPGDVGTDARPVGTFLFGQPANGPGIRTFPYSTDLAVNPHTYDDIKTESVPHGVGSVWCAMLFDMTWALIDEYGFDNDIYNFTGDVNQDAGNVQSMALVTEAMKLQPCSPGFVDGRDAIFAADVALYGGANECLLWDVFARRGLGVSADQGSSGSRSDGTEAFDTPTGLAEFTAPADVCDGTEEITGLGGGTPLGGVYSGPGVTDDGNGMTYSFDPVVAGVGVHTITYTTTGTACAPPSSDTDDIEVLAIPAAPTATGVSDYCPGDDVTVTATPNDGANTIWWFDQEVGGNFLFEGTDYTFTPTGDTSLFAQETPPVPQSQLVISEFTLETPDRLEIQNVGLAFDYTGYTVAVSEQPYDNINTVNTTPQTLGAMGADAVVSWNDDGGGDFWGSNIWWNNDGTGWIIIIDTDGNVVDSAFWNFTAAEIAGLNVTINGFNITAADLDWTGAGATLTAECNDSFRRNGDTDSAADWADVCLASDYGVANADIGLGITGCLGARAEAVVTVDAIDPTITCPADLTVIVPVGDDFTIPDYTGDATAADNCTASPTITQDPASGSTVGVGVHTITLTAEDEAGNDVVCTFDVTVEEEVLGIDDNDLSSNIVLYPNPTRGGLTLVNTSGVELTRAMITDVNGRIIQVVDLNGMTDSKEFSVVNFANGLYFVKIESAETSIVKRIVKQ